MNCKCIICSDLFVAHADIVTTPCGHLFHFVCILQWIDRSPSCPQCRTKVTEKTVRRIYLSVDDNVTDACDVPSLRNQVDNLNFQLKLKSMDVEKYKDKLKVCKDQTLGLRKEVSDLEDKINTLNSATYALKDQIRHFKNKSKECDRLEDEALILKSKINKLESVQLVIKGSREEVNDMLRHNRDPESLSVLVSTLKKELIDSDRRKKQIEVMLKVIQNDVLSKNQELAAMRKENSKLLLEVSEHKNCESERDYLKKRICELKESTGGPIDTHNNTLARIMLESPVPLPRDKHFSPSLPEKVKAIKESDSPYLQVQSTGVGLSELMDYNHITSKRPSIFKHPKLKIETLARSSSFTSYDGLGGHGRDEYIPVRPQSLNIRKRPKSSSIPSAKLRKLTPQQNLDGFF